MRLIFFLMAIYILITAACQTLKEQVINMYKDHYDEKNRDLRFCMEDIYKVCAKIAYMRTEKETPEGVTHDAAVFWEQESFYHLQTGNGDLIPLDVLMCTIIKDEYFNATVNNNYVELLDSKLYIRAKKNECIWLVEQGDLVVDPKISNPVAGEGNYLFSTIVLMEEICGKEDLYKVSPSKVKNKTAIAMPEQIQMPHS